MDINISILNSKYIARCHDSKITSLATIEGETIVDFYSFIENFSDMELSEQIKFAEVMLLCYEKGIRTANNDIKNKFISMFFE